MSSPDDPLHILLVNEHADELKLVTSSLRGLYPHCRIEAGYSSDDALTFIQQAEWQVVIIDHEVLPQSGLEILSHLRRQAPYAAIMLQTDLTDSQTAVQALQRGADFLLFKQSPGFITELLFAVQDALEKRTLQRKLDQTFQRHQRFLETSHDLAYELDRDGRFVYIGPTVTALLGYESTELTGQHYSTLLSPRQEAAARYRFNERRAGRRSVRHVELTLQGKASANIPPPEVTVAVTAKGLSDNAGRYIGTVGLLRDLSQEKAQHRRLTELESRLHAREQRLTRSQEALQVSRRLQEPLATLTQASQAGRLNEQLLEAMRKPDEEDGPFDLNDVLAAAVRRHLASAQSDSLPVRTIYADDLPTLYGAPDAVEDLVCLLLDYVRQDSAQTSQLELTSASLSIEAPSPTGRLDDHPAQPAQQYVSFSIRSGAPVKPSTARPHGDDASIQPLVRAHEIVRAHAGTIEIGHVFDGLWIRVQLPASDELSTATVLERRRHQSPLHLGEVVQSPPPTGAPLQPDRRQFERRLLSLPVELTIGTTPLRGLLRNISSRGALLTLRDRSPSIHLQPAYIAIKTAVSFFELQGRVQERPTEHVIEASAIEPLKDIVIAFSFAAERDRNVLHSLLDGLQDGTTAITFEALIHPAQAALGPPETSAVESEKRDCERRDAIRFVVDVSVRMTESASGAPHRLGRILNLSRDGACLELTPDPTAVAPSGWIQFAILTPARRPAPAEGNTNEPCRAKILWTARDHEPHARGVTTERRERLRIGVQFDHRTVQDLARWRARMLPTDSLLELAEPIYPGGVTTTTQVLRSRSGHGLHLSLDCRAGTEDRSTPIVLICPGYGMTQQAYTAFAYVLADGDLRVCRYDHSRHIGLSGGEPTDTTMTSLEDDFDRVLTFIHDTWPTSPVTVVASDLLGRIALRRHDRRRMMRRLILVHPTLDLGQCLTTLHGRDLIREHLVGRRQGIGNLLGVPIDIDRFLADAAAAQYTDPAGLCDDLTDCTTDILLLSAESDHHDPSIPAPSPALVDDMLRRLNGHALRVPVPSLVLTAGESLPAAREAGLRRIQALCRPSNASVEPRALPHPALYGSIAVRARYEREALRAKYGQDDELGDHLWSLQTGLTAALDELPAYWQSIDQLYQLVQPLRGGDRLLDIGCGLHSFARLLLLNLSYRLRAQTRRVGAPLRYVGVDVTVASLRAAQAATEEALRNVDGLVSGRISCSTPIDHRWVLGRSMESLPFPDGSFDRVVANLALSFAPSPLRALREWGRVLRPGGKLILSAFTPAADVASLYRPTVQARDLDGFTGEARPVMTRLAECCRALRTGRLQGFEEDTLTLRLSQVTSAPARVLRGLDGRILLAAAEKLDSAG